MARLGSVRGYVLRWSRGTCRLRVGVPHHSGGRGVVLGLDCSEQVRILLFFAS